jgi:CheY-like chemotaxis protein
MIDDENKKGNILIAEDDLRGRELLAEMLEIYGYTVYKAKSGKHAVTKISKSKDKFDIILMDIDMPGQMDGIEAVRQIQTKNCKIPIIFVTAYADDETYQQKIREEKLKIAGWVDKPIIGDNEKSLINLIEKEIKKQKARFEIEAVL